MTSHNYVILNSDFVKVLAFVQEQQAVTFSVVPLAEPALVDPPVYQGNDADDIIYSDWTLLSNFLLSAVCWNSMELNPSGTRSGAYAIEEPECRRVCAGLCRAQQGPEGREPMEAYYRGGIAACVFPLPSSGKSDLYVSARSAESLRAFESEFGIDLCWN